MTKNLILLILIGQVVYLTDRNLQDFSLDSRGETVINFYSQTLEEMNIIIF